VGRAGVRVAGDAGDVVVFGGVEGGASEVILMC
jgi:hypothetical protein